MNALLETVGSFVIGGMILLVVISFNINMNLSSVNNIQNSFNLSNAVVNSSIFDYDMYKIGYRVTSNSIAAADSNRIYFATDIDNNGVIDSIEYKTGTVAALSSTENPIDKPLYRRVSGSSIATIGVVTKFILTYYDSIGNNLSYATLASQASRNLIRTIKIQSTFESNEPTDTTYSGLNWTKTFRPKSLR